MVNVLGGFCVILVFLYLKENGYICLLDLELMYEFFVIINEVGIKRV